jgi:hypothetical protein
MTKRTIGTARVARIGSFKAFSMAALLATGLLGSACTVDDLADAESWKKPEQTPAKTPLPPSDPGNPVGTGEKVSKTIDNATGGEIAMPDGTKIEVPAGALPPGVDTITVTSSTEPAPTDYKTVSPVFVFEPDGAVFLKPLKVSIAFAAAVGTDTSDLTMLWSRQRSDGFDMIPTQFSPASGGFSAAGEVTHFSKGMVGKKYVVDPRPAPDPYGD